MDVINLYKDKNDCYGCEACSNVCPHEAVSMQEDEYGFVYPVIIDELCSRCHLCIKSCTYHYSGNTYLTQNAYVASSYNEKIINKSASGAVFATVARKVLSCKGSVYGCSLESTANVKRLKRVAFNPTNELQKNLQHNNGALQAKHIRIDKLEELSKLQGTKYIQSSIRDIYRKVKMDLISGRLVLFSGTPCQVAGLKSSLNLKHYDNLFTIDLICHGVPSNGMFQAYLSNLKKNLKGSIVDIKFRDKSKGWGMNFLITYIDEAGRKKKKRMHARLSSYFALFLDGIIYRDSCYHCRFASQNRVGDITIGDYWGVEVEHPEYLTDNGGSIVLKNGVSCILVNSPQGEELLQRCRGDLNIFPTLFKSVAKHNEQLTMPTKRRSIREDVMNIYLNNGYKHVEEWYHQSIGLRRYLYLIMSILPFTTKNKLKKIARLFSQSFI